MANMDHHCANCGSNNLRVRTSEKIGLLTIEAVWYCNNCGTEHQITSQIVRVRTPTYHERPEALRVNQPLLRADTQTGDLFDGVLAKTDTTQANS
ncbi:MAG: hypothetical protein Q4A60_05800 [Pasteurellaceae bacterium]|nr:hypothetical protein [Pasteurellaceae bacterium]